MPKRLLAALRTMLGAADLQCPDQSRRCARHDASVGTQAAATEPVDSCSLVVA